MRGKYCPKTFFMPYGFFKKQENTMKSLLSPIRAAKTLFSLLLFLPLAVFAATERTATTEPATTPTTTTPAAATDTTAAPAPATAGATEYTLDPNHTFVLFHINHMGFSNQVGKWQANGALTMDENKPKDSKVDVTIRLADVVTGINKLNEHLQEKDFFDVVQFPTATFVSDKVDVTGKHTAKVHGTLTLH